MKSAIARLSADTSDFLKKRLRHASSHVKANFLLRRTSGIEDFFASEEEFARCLALLEPSFAVAEEPDRREYGDFQTPAPLTDAICAYLAGRHIAPDVLIEPTFGKGAFLTSALMRLPGVSTVHGVEIHEPYCWQVKFTLLELFLRNPAVNRPRIFLHCADVFKVNFHSFANEMRDGSTVLVLGNPPWVTNAELGSLNSQNLPRKRNMKALNGLDAITGKGNFDIGEYVILMMLEAFSQCNGGLAMLAKNSVIRNVVHDLPRAAYRVDDLRALRIDAQGQFGASVDASLLSCRFKSSSGPHTCSVASFDAPSLVQKEFGWVDGHFVSEVAAYQSTRSHDGISPFVWRQGVKHDCSRVMELSRQNGRYVNGLGAELDLEPEPIYGLVKSSDLNTLVVTKPGRQVIITQHKIGEGTAHLAQDFPKLHRYLSENAKSLIERKSSIYRGNPPFSIFGIGDYSFKPYKVAISGLYKRSTFSLVPPHEGKPVMLDDTCYFLGFDAFPEAAIACALLNSEPVQKLLGSLVFLDAKRPYTKQILMRIALDRVASNLTFEALLPQLRRMGLGLHLDVTERDWESFLNEVGRGEAAGSGLQLFGPATVSATR
jgi:hypothetical protein